MIETVLAITLLAIGLIFLFAALFVAVMYWLWSRNNPNE